VTVQGCAGGHCKDNASAHSVVIDSMNKECVSCLGCTAWCKKILKWPFCLALLSYVSAYMAIVLQIVWVKVVMAKLQQAIWWSFSWRSVARLLLLSPVVMGARRRCWPRG